MITEETTPLIVEIAKNFILFIKSVDPEWSKGYLRFCSDNSTSETKASYVCRSGVEIIDVLQFKDFFEHATLIGQELLKSIGKSTGLFVLIVDSNFDYKINFEYGDLEKWKISKMKGGTGIPQGLK